MDTLEPTSYCEAAQDPSWTEAMDRELLGLTCSRTWDIVSLPPGKKLIGCKWV